MIMEKKSKVSVSGLAAEITETTKYKPPRTQATARSNIVSPNTKGGNIDKEEEKKEPDSNEHHRKKRQIENHLEKQAYLSDKKQSTTKKRLRRKSSSKKKDQQLLMSLDKISMKEGLDEIPTFQEKSRTQKLNETPEKLTDEDQKINMAYSSSKKIQHFETPINLERSLGRVHAKKSEGKYKVNDQGQEGKEKSELTSEARRKLNRNS